MLPQVSEAPMMTGGEIQCAVHRGSKIVREGCKNDSHDLYEG